MQAKFIYLQYLYVIDLNNQNEVESLEIVTEFRCVWPYRWLIYIE